MPATIPFILGGSLSGSMYTLTTAPTAGQVLQANSGGTAWQLTTLGTAATATVGTSAGQLHANGAALSATTGTFSTDAGLQVSTALKIVSPASSSSAIIYVGARGGGQQGVYVGLAANPTYPKFFLDAFAGRFYLNPSQLSSLDATSVDGTLVIGGRTNVPVALLRANATSTFLICGQTSAEVDTFTVTPAGAVVSASTIKPGSLNTATTAGTSAGQMVYDASGGANTGTFRGWNGSAWQKLDN